MFSKILGEKLRSPTRWLWACRPTMKEVDLFCLALTFHQRYIFLFFRATSCGSQTATWMKNKLVRRTARQRGVKVRNKLIPTFASLQAKVVARVPL